MFSLYLLYIQEALRDLKRHKMRYFFVMLGVIWGTVAVGFLSAVGTGFSHQTQKNLLFNMSAPHLFFFAPGFMSKPYEGRNIGTPIKVKISDVLGLDHILPQVSSYSVLYQKGGVMVRSGETHLTTSIMGVHGSYQKLMGLNVAMGGRFFDHSLVEKGRYVAFLDAALKSKLFGDENPVGKTIMISGYLFHIIGYNDDALRRHFGSGAVYIPYTVYLAMYGDNDLASILVAAPNSESAHVLPKAFYRYFAHRYHFSPDDETTFFKWDVGETRQFFDKFLWVVRVFLFVCGVSCLLVGIIGVCNTMFLIVRERRFEIGLKMALGAHPRMILQQFLVQSVVIVLIAGAIGILIVKGLLGIFSLLPVTKIVGVPNISFVSLLGIVAILIVIGVLAGWLPAKRASMLEIVDVLNA